MKPLRLIADDLTGALDSACSFARASQPVKVAIPGLPLPEGSRLAASTESRDMGREDAILAVIRMVEALHTPDPATIWFKKIDSVMRGHPFAEIGAMLRWGGVDDCILAPAYPAMGRITVATRQYLFRGNGELEAVGPDFCAAFEEIGLSAALVDGVESCGNDASCPIRVVEAREQEELRRRISAIAAVTAGRRHLWAGSGGLALALGGGAAPVSFPPICAFIVGTAHPVSRGQANRLQQADLVGYGPDGAASAPALLTPALIAGDAVAAEHMLRSALQDLDFPEPDRTSILITGGATLTIALQVSAARCLDCIGEAVPGVPVSRIVGGRWDGITLLSKSGGFGNSSLFLDLLRLGGRGSQDGLGREF